MCSMVPGSLITSSLFQASWVRDVTVCLLWCLLYTQQTFARFPGPLIFQTVGARNGASLLAASFLVFNHLCYMLNLPEQRFLCWNCYLTSKEGQISSDTFCRCLKNAFVLESIRLREYIQNADSLLRFPPASASNGVLLSSARFILVRCGQKGCNFSLKRLWIAVPVGVGIWVSEGQSWSEMRKNNSFCAVRSDMFVFWWPVLVAHAQYVSALSPNSASLLLTRWVPIGMMPNISWNVI